MHNAHPLSYPSFETSPALTWLFPCTGTLPQQHITQSREGQAGRKMKIWCIQQREEGKDNKERCGKRRKIHWGAHATILPKPTGIRCRPLIPMMTPACQQLSFIIWKVSLVIKLCFCPHVGLPWKPFCLSLVIFCPREIWSYQVCFHYAAR